MLLDDAEVEYDSPAVQPGRHPRSRRRGDALHPARARATARLRRARRGGRRRCATSPATGTTGPAGSPWTPDGTALVAHRRRGRPLAGVPGRRRRRRVHPADRRRLRLLRRAGLARRAAPSTRCARRTPSRSRPVRLDATTPDQQSDAAARPGRRRRRCPARLEDVETTAADGTRVRSWLCLPEGASADAPGAAAAVDPRRPAGLVERLVVALEPVDRGRPRLRRAAARPGAVHRLRPGLHPPRLGRAGARRRTPT